MKKVIYLLILILLFIASCNKYSLSDKSYSIKHNDLRDNVTIYDGEYYYTYTGRLLISGGDVNSKVTIYNIYYDVSGTITRIEANKTMILKKNKVYAISLINSIAHYQASNSEIKEYISMRQGLYVYDGYDVIVEEK